MKKYKAPVIGIVEIKQDQTIMAMSTTNPIQSSDTLKSFKVDTSTLKN